MYGKELILDLYGCDPSTFNRISIEKWLKQLCDLIDMQREDLHFWDYEGCPEEKANAPVHLVGTSAVQFITTSDIVIHTVDMLQECYINIFSCKDFDLLPTVDFTKNWFKAGRYEYQAVTRGRMSKV
jgi:S-adenosylmethionine/arginine decarboxylase-like enzyme